MFTTADNIDSVSKLKTGFEPAPDCFKGAIIKSNANIYIKFNKPVAVNRLYRGEILITELVMSIDNADAFIAALPVA